MRALVVAGSDLYVGGQFTQAGGATANRVARWSGSVWSSLGSGGKGEGVNGGNLPTVYDLAISGSDFYVGGVFAAAGGQASSSISKWTPISERLFANGFEGF